MGYKNRTHRQKRIISERKFNRIYLANMDKAGKAYRSIKGIPQQSLAAIKVGDILYAKFLCKDGTSTFCIRYNLNEEMTYSSLDYTAFSLYPKHIRYLLAVLDLGKGEIF